MVNLGAFNWFDSFIKKLNKSFRLYQPCDLYTCIAGMIKHTARTSKLCRNQHIFTKVHVKCLFMIRFSKLNILQKAGTLLDISWLVLVPNLNATIYMIYQVYCIAKLIISSSDASPINMDTTRCPPCSYTCLAQAALLFLVNTLLITAQALKIISRWIN